MSISRQDVRVGGFYAKDNVRGRTHVREITRIYTDDYGKVQVEFLVHNLVGQEPFCTCTTMTSFLVWVDRETDNPRGQRDTSNNRQSFEGCFIVYQHPHPERYTTDDLHSYPYVRAEGLKFTVHGGRMSAGGGGVQLWDVDGEAFGFGYDLIDRITELDGTIIWQNVNGSWRE